MKQIMVRWGEPRDGMRFADWMLANTDKNHFDPDVVKYPLTKVLCAYDEEGPLAYLPYQPVICVESAAWRPGVTDLQKANAAALLMKQIVFQSASSQIKEVVFLVTDPAIAKVAGNHGFEEMPWRLMRLKIDSLEGQT